MAQSLGVKKLDFLYFDAGGGHRSAATALRQVMEQQGAGVEIRMVNLQEILDEIDVFRKLTRHRLQDVYNLLLKRGWTFGSPQLVVMMHLLIRMFHRQQVRVLERYWKKSRPDLVVSLVPNFNRALCQSLETALPGTRLVTILTDIADYPPHFWLEPHAQDVVCGSEKAAQQARAQGHAGHRVHRVSGMILNPRFYDVTPLPPEDRAAARKALGFDPAKPVGLVLFGGQGSKVMLEIAQSLPDRQLILICGHNEKLAAKLKAIPHPAPLFVEGFTKEIPRYMQLSDYLIGKPGPGTISEAVAMHLPVIVERNAWTLPQERYNAEWVEEQGIGIVLRNFREVAAAVERLLRPGEYEKFRAATERIENRAVFEIADLIQRLLPGSEL